MYPILMYKDKFKIKEAFKNIEIFIIPMNNL